MKTLKNDVILSVFNRSWAERSHHTTYAIFCDLERMQSAAVSGNVVIPLVGNILNYWTYTIHLVRKEHANELLHYT